MASDSPIVPGPKSTEQTAPIEIVEDVHPNIVPTERSAASRSRKELFDDALAITLSRHRRALDELGKY